MGCSSETLPKPTASPSVILETATAGTVESSPSAEATPSVQTSTKAALPSPKTNKSPGDKILRPTTSALPAPIKIGVPTRWEETPPSRLAAPWTDIPPAATSTTIAVVQLDPQTILIAANRGLFRTASIITGINKFRISRGMMNSATVDYVHVTCPSGAEIWAGIFSPYKSWTTTEHPGTFTALPADEPSNPCSNYVPPETD